MKLSVLMTSTSKTRNDLLLTYRRYSKFLISKFHLDALYYKIDLEKNILYHVII